MCSRNPFFLHKSCGGRFKACNLILPDLTLPCLGFAAFSNIIVFESKSFFHAIGNKQKLVPELLGIQIILFNIEARGRGGEDRQQSKSEVGHQGAPHP